MDKFTLKQQRYIKKVQRHKRIIFLQQILLFLFFLGLWEFSASTGLIDDFIFSSPSRVIKSMISMAADGSLFIHIGTTLMETVISFMLVTFLSIFVSVLLWMNHSLSEIVEPYLVMLNSLPKSALAPLLIVWLGNNTKTIIVAAISVAVFGSIISLYTNFREMDSDKIKLIYTLGGNKKIAMKKVIIPGSIPIIISNMKVNIGLCLVGVVIGEFLAAKQGLGYLIIYGSQVFKLDWVIMSIVILCIVAMGLYSIINLIEKKYH